MLVASSQVRFLISVIESDLKKSDCWRDTVHYNVILRLRFGALRAALRPGCHMCGTSPHLVAYHLGEGVLLHSTNVCHFLAAFFPSLGPVHILRA